MKNLCVWCTVCEVRYDPRLEVHEVDSIYELGRLTPSDQYCSYSDRYHSEMVAGPRSDDMEYVYKSLGVVADGA